MSFRLITARAVAGAMLTLTAAQAGQWLTPGMADRATAYMEWMLDAHFTPSERRQYQQNLREIFRSNNQSAIDGVVEMVRAEDRLESMTPEERAAKHERVQTAFLRLLRDNPNDDGSRWLLGIYEAAHVAPAPRPAPYPTPNSYDEPAPRPYPVAANDNRAFGRLLGQWKAGRVSMIQYKNSYTGAPAPTSGTHFEYTFNPDGTYQYSGLMQNTMYNCTNSIFSLESGTYRFDGDVLSLRPEKNPYKMTNNCAHSSDHESPGKLINRSYHVRFGVEGSREKLDLIPTDGSGTSSFTRDR